MGDIPNVGLLMLQLGSSIEHLPTILGLPMRAHLISQVQVGFQRKISLREVDQPSENDNTDQGGDQCSLKSKLSNSNLLHAPICEA